MQWPHGKRAPPPIKEAVSRHRFVRGRCRAACSITAAVAAYDSDPLVLEAERFLKCMECMASCIIPRRAIVMDGEFAPEVLAARRVRLRSRYPLTAAWICTGGGVRVMLKSCSGEFGQVGPSSTKLPRFGYGSKIHVQFDPCTVYFVAQNDGCPQRLLFVRAAQTSARMGAKLHVACRIGPHSPSPEPFAPWRRSRNSSNSSWRRFWRYTGELVVGKMLWI